MNIYIYDYIDRYICTSMYTCICIYVYICILMNVCVYYKDLSDHRGLH